MTEQKVENHRLKGWKEIASFLGQSVATAQRWAKSGMTVTREGRYTTASCDELNAWLAGESGNKPVHIATDNADLSADLKHALRDVKQRRKRGG